MTNTEKIIAEINRTLNLFPKKPNGEVLPIDQNAYNLISDLKTFIESLPAEKSSEQLCWNGMTEEEKSDFFFNLRKHYDGYDEDLDIDEELKKFFEINNLYVDVNDLQTVCHYNGDATNKTYYFWEVARYFANKQKEQTIKKACKWLAGNVINYIWCSKGGGLGISDEFFIDFKKAIEDE